MSDLVSLLKEGANAEGPRNQFLASFGMRKNPFPPARTINAEVMYNQEHAIRRFAECAVVVGQGDPARRSLAIVGGTGQGKSHFQRYCQRGVKISALPIVAVEFLAGTASSTALVREMFRAADEYVKGQGAVDFLSAVVARTGENEIASVKQTDLRKALTVLVRASRAEYIPEDLHRKYDFHRLLEVCNRWLVGESLSQTDKKYLGVFSRLATGSLMIRVMTELFVLGRRQDLFKGVMICLDEVEALFSSGVPYARIQSFLQDLRYLFDESLGKEAGYSLLFVSGSTPIGINALRGSNFPLYDRLGFEPRTRVELHLVSDITDARKFADEYIRHEWNEFSKVKGAEISFERARSLITDDDLQQVFYGTANASGSADRAQAYLLEGLHRVVQSKVSAASGAQS